jgi:cell division protein FtsL
MRKKSPSKLDQYADTLLAMDAERDPRKTLADMQAWLKQEGVTISEGQLSKFLTAQRNARQQQSLLDSIVSGARQAKEVEQRFEKNSAPELDTLIKLLRVAILNLSTQAQTDAGLLKLVDQLTRTVMEFVSAQTKASHKERELRLAEDKFQIEFCELILDKATREAAERIANTSMSQADKIAAMRQATFKDVAALKQSGSLNIPKA